MLDRYAVFGNPVEHSQSPQIHKQFALQTDQRLAYEKRLVDEALFEETVNTFFLDGGDGLNITVPFKERAFAMADILSERAQSAGAVNTLWVKDEKLYGDNTDGVGLVADIRGWLNWPIYDKKILILGAGGASRGVLLPLLTCEPRQLVIANRTEEKAKKLTALGRSFKTVGDVDIRSCNLDSLVGMGGFDIIINATSTSLLKQGLTLPSTLCTEKTACYDMVYSDEATPFLRWAMRCGASHTADGLGMLVEQAAEAFYIWRGVRPQTDKVRKQLRA